MRVTRDAELIFRIPPHTLTPLFRELESTAEAIDDSDDNDADDDDDDDDTPLGARLVAVVAVAVGWSTLAFMLTLNFRLG